MFTPSPQQAAIFDWVSTGDGSAVIEAVAGAGKTTTLIEAVSMMKGQVFLGAYNKAISVDIANKLTSKGIDSTRVKSATMHSAGFSAVKRMWRDTRIDGKKMQDIGNSMKLNPAFPMVLALKLASLAKQEGIYIDDYVDLHAVADHHNLSDDLPATCSMDTVISVVHEMLEKSNKSCEQVVDFDDMIYAPLLSGARFFQHDWVLVDEAQDTNRVRRMLAAQILRPNGRLIAVGDSRQAIYGFTGASADSLDLIANQFKCVRLPLTVTYRCPKAIVTHAQKWVKHIEAHETAPEGIVRELDRTLLFKEKLTRHDAIVCRNVKPLVEVAYGLLQNGTPCHIEGRDVGKSLIVMVKRFKVSTLAELDTNLREWFEKEKDRLAKSEQGDKIASLEDKVTTLLSVIHYQIKKGNTTPGAVIKFLDGIFEDTLEGKVAGSVTLATIHKSKGREWDKVYLLGRNLFMPSKYAKQDWQLVQETNLIYVAITRAKKELVEVVF